MGSGCIDPRFLDLDTSCSRIVSFTLLKPYHWGKSPWYPLDSRFGGPQSWSGRYVEVKICSEVLSGSEM
jgi:hypothetical protein